MPPWQAGIQQVHMGNLDSYTQPHPGTQMEMERTSKGVNLNKMQEVSIILRAYRFQSKSTHHTKIQNILPDEKTINRQGDDRRVRFIIERHHEKYFSEQLAAVLKQMTSLSREG